MRPFCIAFQRGTADNIKAPLQLQCGECVMRFCLLIFIRQCSVYGYGIREINNKLWDVFPGKRMLAKHLLSDVYDNARNADECMEKCTDVHFGSFFKAMVSNFWATFRIN